MKNILIVFTLVFGFTLAFGLTTYAQTLTPAQMAALAAAQGGTYFDKAQLSRNDTFRLRVGAAMYQVATEAFADSAQVVTHEYAARVLQNASSQQYIDHFTRAALLFPLNNASLDLEIYGVIKQLWPNIVRAWLVETGRIKVNYEPVLPVEPTTDGQ